MNRLQSLLCVTSLPALSMMAAAQVTFSVKFGSPTISAPDCYWAIPITEADLLEPATPLGLPTWGATLPLGPPGIRVSGGFGPPVPGLALPAHPPCIGHPPGLVPPCFIEVDALSHGVDFNLDPAVPYMIGGNLLFSVDNYALGLPGPFFPDVASEAAAIEAAADIFTDVSLQPFPLPPGAIPSASVGVFDGDGLPSANNIAYPALGLFEPSPPGPWPTPGDDVDAFDAHTPLQMFASVYYSLESAFPDPITGAPASGAAAANAFVGGDVLVSIGPGAPPLLYAAAPQLGLDLIGGPDSDDLDALILWENGDGLFTPSTVPYDWATGVGTDMLLFSVRRGSAIIGVPDSLLGVPIEEGDILTTPITPGAPPGMLIAAENFGLQTVRSNGVPFADEVDAADASGQPVLDCDLSGVEDALDLAVGYQTDTNLDGVPDPCQLLVTPYCYGVGCPCGNDDPAAGCANSTGLGGLLAASGSSVWAKDDLQLNASGLPGGVSGLYFMGTLQIQAPFGDGFRCVAGMTQRFAITTADAAGNFPLGPGISAISLGFPLAFQVLPGSSWAFQCWYRNPTGPCGGLFNLTNGISVLFVP